MLRIVMGFSWGWVKPDPMMTTDPLAQGRLELARAAMPQGTLRPAGSQPVLEKQQQGSHQRQQLLAAPA